MEPRGSVCFFLSALGTIHNVQQMLFGLSAVVSQEVTLWPVNNPLFPTRKELWP